MQIYLMEACAIMQVERGCMHRVEIAKPIRSVFSKAENERILLKKHVFFGVNVFWGFHSAGKICIGILETSLFSGH